MNLYKEIILDHFHNPRNKGELPNSDIYACEENSLCGDKFCMSLEIEKDVITDIKFQGEGCALSLACASLLTEHLKGKTILEAEKIDKDTVLGWWGGEDVTPARLKCALLALEALRRGLKNVGSNLRQVPDDNLVKSEP